MGCNISTQTNRGNRILFEDEPFDEGSIRYCFKGEIISGPGKNQLAVVKVFKYPPIRTSYISAAKQHKVYSIGNDYARMFNRLLQQNGYEKTISFPEPDLVKVDLVSFQSQCFDYFKKGDYICAQRYLRGKYRKFTNNAGYTTRDETMQCFQHYTFVKSGCRAVVCDLQGVVTRYKYLLTDPAVNSITQEFGNTDCGREGIKNVMGRHKCNKICRDIGLDKNAHYNPHLQAVYNSTSQRLSHTSGI